MMKKSILAAGLFVTAAFGPVRLQAQTPIKWVTIGNSITYGTGTTPGSASTGYTNSYPARLAVKLGAGYSLQNDGVNSMQMLKSGNHPYWTQGKLAAVFAFQPNVITICLGTNDSKPRNWKDSVNFVRDYTAFVDTLSAMPSHPQIWLCLPTPSFQAIPSPVNWNDTSTHDGYVIKNSIIPRILQVAAAKGLRTIDLQTPLANRQNLFPDGVHPNNAGADTIASIIYRAYIATTGVYPVRKPSVDGNSRGGQYFNVAYKPLIPGLFGSMRFYALDGSSLSSVSKPLASGAYILRPALTDTFKRKDSR